MDINDNEWALICLALGIAAEAFDRDATVTDNERLTAQFRQQATEARGLADRLREQLGL